MRNRVSLRLTLIRAVALAVFAIAAVTFPTEILATPQGRGGAIPSKDIQGYRVGEIKIIGARILKWEFLAASLGVTGEVFDQSRLRKGFEDMKKLYGALGYVNFVADFVMDLDEQKKVVNLTVTVDEGRQYFVNRITFTGTTTIPDEVIRRNISLKEGYVFNSQQLELTLARLNKLGLFEEIKMQDALIKPHTDEPKVDIELRVKEKAR